MSRLRRVIPDDCGRRSVGGDLLLNFPLFDGQATPVSKQHEALVPSISALLILAVGFSICSTVRHVCLLTLVLRCTLFIFCVKALPRGHLWRVYLLVLRTVHHVYTCITQVAARKQPPCPSNTRRWSRQFLVIYRCLDKVGRVWHKASVSDCLPLAAPIGLSPLLIVTLCGSERVLIMSTEPPDDLSCLTTPGVGCPRDGLFPVPLTRCIQMHTPSPCGVWRGGGGYKTGGGGMFILCDRKVPMVF